MVSLVTMLSKFFGKKKVAATNDNQYVNLVYSSETIEQQTLLFNRELANLAQAGANDDYEIEVMEEVTETQESKSKNKPHHEVEVDKVLSSGVSRELSTHEKLHLLRDKRLRRIG